MSSFVFFACMMASATVSVLSIESWLVILPIGMLLYKWRLIAFIAGCLLGASFRWIFIDAALDESLAMMLGSYTGTMLVSGLFALLGVGLRRKMRNDEQQRRQKLQEKQTPPPDNI